MIELCRLIWCGPIGLFRSRASLEIEILALRRQLNILRRTADTWRTLMRMSSSSRIKSAVDKTEDAIPPRLISL
jgi:hypothetical protein